MAVLLLLCLGFSLQAQQRTEIEATEVSSLSYTDKPDYRYASAARWETGFRVTPASVATAPVIADLFGRILAVVFTLGLYDPSEDVTQYNYTPGFQLYGAYKANDWLQLGVSASFGSAGTSHYDSVGGNLLCKDKYVSFSLEPYVKFIWLRRSKFSMGSVIGIGPGLCLLDEWDDPQSDLRSRSKELKLYPDYELVPIAMSFGGRLFGSLDLGLGTQCMGVRAGVGYRF